MRLDLGLCLQGVAKRTLRNVNVVAREAVEGGEASIHVDTMLYINC